MNLKEILIKMEEMKEPSQLREFLDSLTFEVRFNAIRELIYHIDVFLAERNRNDADKALKSAEMLSPFLIYDKNGKRKKDVRALRIIAMKKRAKFYEYFGEYDRAIDKYEKIISFLELPEEENFYAEMIMEAGILEEQLGRNNKALNSFRKASKVYSVHKDDFNFQASLFNCAHVLYDMQQTKKAAKYCKKVIDHYKESGKPRSPLAHSYLELANIFDRAGDDEKAKVYYKKALDVYRQLGSKIKVSDILNRIGVYEINDKNFETAREVFMEALDIKRDVDFNQAKGYFYESMGDQLRSGVEYDGALTYYNMAYLNNSMAGAEGRNLIIKHKIFKILHFLDLESKDMGTFIEKFKPEKPEVKEVIKLDRISYRDQSDEGAKSETMKDWKVHHSFAAGRKFLIFLLRNLSKTFTILRQDKEAMDYFYMKKSVEKSYKQKKGRP